MSEFSQRPAPSEHREGFWGLTTMAQTGAATATGPDRIQPTGVTVKPWATNSLGELIETSQDEVTAYHYFSGTIQDQTLVRCEWIRHGAKYRWCVVDHDCGPVVFS